MAGVPALIKNEALEAAGVTITETSLQIANPDQLSWDGYFRLAEHLAILGRGYCWWVGDLLNNAETVGHEWAQLEKILPHSPHTLTNYKSVAAHVPRSRRRKSLSFSTHAEVAYLEPRIRDEWLDKAERYDWKREEMRSALDEAGLKPKKSGLGGLVGQTGKTGRLGQAGLDHEERSSGAPAAVIGEPVPSPATCPHCGGILE